MKPRYLRENHNTNVKWTVSFIHVRIWRSNERDPILNLPLMISWSSLWISKTTIGTTQKPCSRFWQSTTLYFSKESYILAQMGDESHCFALASSSPSSASFHSRRTKFALSDDLGTMRAEKISGIQTKPCVSFSWSGRMGLPSVPILGRMLKAHKMRATPRNRERSATCMPGHMRRPAPNVNWSRFVPSGLLAESYRER
jgi:hypothetical protein